jgi:hypothetical protein
LPNFSNENEMRDFLFDNHKGTFFSLIKGKKSIAKWKTNDFPPVRFLIQQNTERRINKSLDDLRDLILEGKEIRLDRASDSTTRIDLIGHYVERTCLTIIELKKSKQTERQAFTELLAYANHFSVLFPGLSDDGILSILIAPMESRTVRDAYFQELVTNGKNTIVLIPKLCDDDFSLEVYYPGDQYYRWIENKIFKDYAFVTVVAAFPEIEGWIDTDRDNNGKPPRHSVEAMNKVALVVAQKLEAAGLHGMVYGRQLWWEVARAFPNPNSIVVSVLNPFNDIGDMTEGRNAEIQAIISQLAEEGDSWLEKMRSGFDGRIIRLVQESFDISFQQAEKQPIQPEISLPHWGGFKSEPLETVICHNFDLLLTGIVREIYHTYIKHIYKNGFDEIHYADDLPMFSYDTLNDFFQYGRLSAVFL